MAEDDGVCEDADDDFCADCADYDSGFPECEFCGRNEHEGVLGWIDLGWGMACTACVEGGSAV